MDSRFLNVVVNGDSMWPNLPAGSTARFEKVEADALEVDQIVLLDHPFRPDLRIIKRIQSITEGKAFLVGDNPDPTHLATCDKIRDTAHKNGIKAVMHCASAAFAAGAIKRGFDMVMLTSDLNCMIAGAKQQLDSLKAKTG